jgi:hypothetical protein
MKRTYQFFNRTKTNPPTFMGKLNGYLARSWGSLGSISFSINQPKPNHYEIMFFPAVRELHGGKNDGELYFPGFKLNIGKFIRVFDKDPAPKVSFDCLQNCTVEHLLFVGRIDGCKIKVAVLSGPPQGQSPVEKVYTIGPKKGMIEPIESV